jgi:hypothetical protein
VNEINLFCWLWKGWRPVYTAKHVNALARMLALHAPDVTLTCITDMPAGITECATVPLWPDPPNLRLTQRLNCFRRLQLFDPATQRRIGAVPGTILGSIDLDTLIIGELPVPHDLLESKTDFAAVQGMHCLYNGSYWLQRAGKSLADVWSTFDPATSPRVIQQHRARGKKLLGSDQAWMSLTIPNGVKLWEADGVYSYPRHGNLERCVGMGSLWTFPGAIKPWHDSLKSRSAWLHAEYMRHYE